MKRTVLIGLVLLVGTSQPACSDIDSEYIKVLGGDTGPIKLEIAFDRRAFCETLTEPGKIEITVSGLLTTGREFYANDTIRIKKMPPTPIKIKTQHPHRRAH